MLKELAEISKLLNLYIDSYIPLSSNDTMNHLIEETITSLEHTLGEIEQRAHQIHADVNQFYGDNLPYGYHLSQVAAQVRLYAPEIIQDINDVLPVFFAAYFHDSIEDARLTYNDVKKIALEYMSESQAYTAVEIVYALTNDKGRTREERAGAHYYEGIRNTPYAPFVKLCDRLANMTFSFQKTNESNRHMCEVYRKEWSHFISSIKVCAKDLRYTLPLGGLTYAQKLLKD